MRAIWCAAVACCIAGEAASTTVAGDFVEGGDVNVLTGFGVLGEADVIVDAPVGPESFLFTFEVAQGGFVTGLGNVRRASGFNDLAITFDGRPVALLPTQFDESVFAFPTIATTAGQQFDVVVSYASATAANTIDFDIEVSPIPLPQSGALLAAAVFAVAAAIRRRAACAAA